jgi:hypothetical protein
MALTFENFRQDAVMHPSSRKQFRRVYFFVYFYFLFFIFSIMRKDAVI